jgi:hypothetical protein
MAGIRNRFSEVVVCVHRDDLAKGYWVREFEEAGLKVLAGAHFSDENGLRRVRALASQFEFVTSNGCGSHMVYAASSGARVSIYGPFAHVDAAGIGVTGKSGIPTPFFLLLVAGQAEPVLRENFPFLFVNPWDAREVQAWGEHESGMDSRLSPCALRERSGWNANAIRRYRVLRRPVERTRSLARALVPASLHGAVRAALGRRV